MTPLEGRSANARQLVFALTLCTASTLGLSLAAAQSGPAVPLPAEVALHAVPCAGAEYDAGELAELLRVELRELGVVQLRVQGDPAVAPANGTLALIHLGCGPSPSTVAIELADLVAGNRVTRELSVDDVPERGRARALSIAIASLLESSWSLLAAQPVGAAEGVGPAPMPDSVRVALRRRLSVNLPRTAVTTAVPTPDPDPELPPVFQRELPAEPFKPSFALGTAVIARSFPARGSGLSGFVLSGALAISKHMRLALDLEAMYGRQLIRDATREVAELETFWLSVGAALYVATSTEPNFMVGPMVRAAYVRVLSATNDETFIATDQDGSLLMLGLSSLLRFELSPRWGLFFGADIAYVPGGINFRADDMRVISLADLALSFRLGVSFWP